MVEFLYTILCISCLITGFFYGFKIGRQEKIKSPIEKVKEKIMEHKERIIEKEQEKTINTFNDILANIDNYDGSSNNQKEV